MTFLAAATASPPVAESAARHLATLEEPLDVLVPFVYHRSLPHLVRPVCRVTVEYHSGAGTRLSDVDAGLEPFAWDRTVSALVGGDAGHSSVVYAPANQPHRAEMEAAISGTAPLGTSNPAQALNGYSFGGGPNMDSSERKNAKQGFLETLLNGGSPDSAGSGGADNGALPLASEVRTRLHDETCDASQVAHAALLVLLVGLVAASRVHAGRTGVRCVTVLDVSRTKLGRVGKGMPATAFDAHGQPLPTQPESDAEARVDKDKESSGNGAGRDEDVGADGEDATATGGAADHAQTPSVTWTLPMRFFPDEREPRSATPAKVLDDIAERSLCLCYVAPLLYQPSSMSYRIEVLMCVDCALTDTDATVIAGILTHKFTKRFECHLRTLDLSENEITNTGAQALCDALKYNRLVSNLELRDNDGVTDERIVRTMEKRLRRNRDGKSNLAWYEKHKRWFH